MGAFLGRDSPQGLKGGHRRVAPVEAKDQLVHIARKMLGRNTVMRSVQPGREMAEHAVDVGNASRGLAGITDDADMMCVRFQG